MAEKVVRGQLLTFTATPKDAAGNLIEPATVKLYLNYKHANGTTSTDSAIDMTQLSDGSYFAEFDTKVCLPGKLNIHIRTDNPEAAADDSRDIIANAANPAPSA